MAIITDTDGLITGLIQIPSKRELIPAYRAAPNSNGPFPIVLVMHQVYGINNYTQDICRRLAKVGYLAVMPNLYARYGDVTGLSKDEVMKYIATRVEDDLILEDLDATVAWAVEQEAGDEKRLGITGFAWGAQFVWLFAAHSISLKAAVCWYGRLVREVSPSRPTPWRQIVSSLKAPVLGIYAGTDPYVSIQTLDEMRQTLALAPVKNEIIFFPDARHGFHADYQPHYRPKDAKIAWEKQMEWFNQYGVR